MDNRENEVITTAASIEKAILKALESLQAERDEVQIEVLEEPSRRLFGGATDAKVRVCLKENRSEEDIEEAREREEGTNSSEDLDDSKGNEAEEVEEAEDVGETEEAEETGSREENEEEDLDGEVNDEAEEADEVYDDDSAANFEEDAFNADDETNYNKAYDQLTDEELDIIADTSIETLRGILVYFGAEEAEIEEYEGEEGELILDIVGENLAMLIGRHGKTLDAMQFLVSSIVSKKTGYRYPVVIDVKAYKHRRKQKIVSIAKASAARAIRQKHEVRLRPMTPFERRIVHIALREDKRVTTYSEGIEPNRCVIIQPT